MSLLLPVALWLLPEAGTDVMLCKITLSHYVKICLCPWALKYHSFCVYISFTKATEGLLITAKFTFDILTAFHFNTMLILYVER